MKVGITGRLFMAIFATCMLVLITMHWGVRLSFERGFIDYIKHGNEQRMTLLSDNLGEQYNLHGNWDFLRNNTNEIFQIMRSFDQKDDNNLPPSGWRTKFWVLDSNFKKLVGHPGQPAPGSIRQPIISNNQTVGWVVSMPTERLTRDADINFDHQQQRTSWMIVALATLLAALVTWVLSRSFLAPVKRLVTGTHQLAAGDFSTRVAVGSSDELGRLAQDFNQLASTLEKNEQVRQGLIADISHELRTPLAVLRGELEALQDGVRQPTAQSLQSLQSEVTTLTKLVDDLHQLALSDRGALAYRKYAIDVVHLVELAVATFADRFANKSLRITTQLPPQVLIFADPDRLSQLFNNLMENSLRYTDPHGELMIIGEIQPEGLCLYWQDSAPGISDEQLERIFERFYRAEGSRNRASGGSGLGLAISHNIVEAHNGTMTAEHSPLGGVRIRVLLPFPA